jgi:hypothetical protein
MTYPRPVLVVSNGRTGSSTIPRLLHEVCRVDMGSVFPPPNAANPKGYYEDQDFRGINTALAESRDLNPYHWEFINKAFIAARMGRGTSWGLKDPWLCFFIGIWIDLLDAKYGVRPVIIRPRRKLHLICSSLYECGASKDAMISEEWRVDLVRNFKEIAIRQLVLEKNLEGYPDLTVHDFWFKGQVPDVEVVQFLQHVLSTEHVAFDEEGVEAFTEAELRGEEANPNELRRE